jgi:hypothetical protein
VSKLIEGIAHRDRPFQTAGPTAAKFIGKTRTKRMQPSSISDFHLMAALPAHTKV